MRHSGSARKGGDAPPAGVDRRSGVRRIGADFSPVGRCVSHESYFRSPGFRFLVFGLRGPGSGADKCGRDLSGTSPLPCSHLAPAPAFLRGFGDRRPERALGEDPRDQGLLRHGRLSCGSRVDPRDHKPDFKPSPSASHLLPGAVVAVPGSEKEPDPLPGFP